MREYSLGIDTSNYKTSVALVDRDDNIIYDERIFLKVPEGSIGIRQQDALFQHIGNLPILLEGAFEKSRDGKIVAVAASNRPRPIEGSYMPCFLAGEKQCKVISDILECHSTFFSHQEGHLAAAARFTEFKDMDEYAFFHFSGGTTEILRYSEGKINILGDTLDISFGQLLDRIGAYMGYHFPAGENIDKLACEYIREDGYKNTLPKIKVNKLEFNLSGIETASKNLIGQIDNNKLSYMLLERVLECIEAIIENANAEYLIKDYLFAGGVSSSKFIRTEIKNFLEDKQGILNVQFAAPNLSTDNAVGIAFLGGDTFWRLNR